MDITANLAEFNKGFNANDRSASFDYCFNYFHRFHLNGNVAAISSDDYLQQSCLQLGFYLASWGMYRGKAKILKHSSLFLRPIVEVIAKSDELIWKIDIDRYGEDQIDALDGLYKRIAEDRPWMSDTLVTKIMLGVFGNAPAFDRYFVKGCSSMSFPATFGKKALRRLAEFYREHSEEIDQAQRHTLDFMTNSPTELSYTKAKVVDMILFREGERLLSQQ